MPNSIQILVLQSTSFCNINCRYCYLPDRHIAGKMSSAVLGRVGEAIIASPRWADDSLVLWHAGEPTSLGVEWYREAHKALSAARGKPLRIQFQTNGTLIDQGWIDFFRSGGIWLGLSIDGAEPIHDAFRRTRAGKPTFGRVMESVGLLRAHQIPFTTISVVTSESLRAPDEIYDFFDQLRPEKVAFSIEEEEGANTKSSLYREDLIGKVEHFFYVLAKRNFSNPKPLLIREIDDVLAGLLRPKGRTSRSQETELGWIVSVGANGDVALHSPELLTTRQANGAFTIAGNIVEQSLEEIIGSEAAKLQHAEIQKGVQICSQTCEYFENCGGGSPANKYFEHGRFDVAETLYCRLAKKATVRGILRAIIECRRAGPESRQETGSVRNGDGAPWLQQILG